MMALSTRKAVWKAAEQVRIAVNRTGFDVVRESFRHKFVAIAEQNGIDTILDVGANTGQFGQALRRAKFAGQILSVEPLGAAFATLSRRAGRDRNWRAERAAVSSELGSLTINVAGNSVSSSVLPMLDMHAEAAPESRYIATEEVPATTVDDLVARYQLQPEKTLLKIDVQGYELAVLEGAKATLPRIGAVRMELSLAPLYDGQKLMAEMVDFMAKLGLELWIIEPGFADPKTRRLLQLDGVFFPSSKR
jgi:FkbM family methyltransferase